MITGTPAVLPRRHRQGGAALLLALVAVALITTLVGGMVWQQFRAIQVESAERARTQAVLILNGALDWSRLILREDLRGDTNHHPPRTPKDHPGEPWATPLAEARLSTFLATEGQPAGDADAEAFLSGGITDAQARYNLRNLLGEDGKPVAAQRVVVERLCARAGLPVSVAERIVTGLLASWGTRTSADAARPDPVRPVPIRRFEQLAWLGIDENELAALRPWVDILPSPTPVNVNTASRDVIAAVLGIDGGAAERLVQQRQRNPFDKLDDVQPLLPDGVTLDPKRLSVATSHFIVTGRLRLEDRVLEEHVLVQRRGSGNATEVVPVVRVRRSQHLGGT